MSKSLQFSERISTSRSFSVFPLGFCPSHWSLRIEISRSNVLVSCHPFGGGYWTKDVTILNQEVVKTVVRTLRQPNIFKHQSIPETDKEVNLMTV